jgi:hypothetical protein
LEVREGKLIAAEEGRLLVNEDAGPFFTARVDCFELVQSMPNELDSDGEHEDESDGTDDGAGDASGDAHPPRAVAQEMDDLTLQGLVISRDVDSSWGFEAGSLMVGQRFPTKHAAKIAITRYAVSISREYKSKRSNPECLKVLCVQPNCPGRIRATQQAISTL